MSDKKKRRTLERPHPPNDAESRRKRNFPYGGVNSISAASAEQGGFAEADESSGGTVEEFAGNYKRELRVGTTGASGGGFFAGVKLN